jgi:hypothetical protein
MKCRNLALAAIVILLSATNPVSAQILEADEEFETVFAPFVFGPLRGSEGSAREARLARRTRYRGRSILFRSSAPFEGTKIDPSTRIAEVPYGAESYIDTPPETGTWYYFVAATDKAGTRYDLVIPYLNVASAVVKESEAAIAAAAALAASESISVFSGVRAQVQGDSVLVSYEGGRPETGAVLYRSATPIARVQDLLGAVIVLAGQEASPFIDYRCPASAITMRSWPKRSSNRVRSPL